MSLIGSHNNGDCLDVSLPSMPVMRSLEQIIEERVKPKVTRCDNGPKYVSHALAKWANEHDITLAFIQPGNPQQNELVNPQNVALHC